MVLLIIGKSVFSFVDSLIFSCSNMAKIIWSLSCEYMMEILNNDTTIGNYRGALLSPTLQIQITVTLIFILSASKKSPKNFFSIKVFLLIPI